MSEAQRWIQLARAGDRKAQQALLDRHRLRLEALIRARLGDGLRSSTRASDILQSTFIDILRSLQKFPGETEEDFASWSLRITENNIRDAARYFAADRRTKARETSSGDTGLADRVMDPHPSPSAEAAYQDEVELIARAMESLPEDYARILQMHLDPASDHQRTAEALGRSVGASRALLARARAALLIEMNRLQKSSERPQ